VEVALGRGQSGVAHPVFEGDGVDLTDGDRAERMAQVVEAERSQAGGIAGTLVALAYARRRERLPVTVMEDEVLRGGVRFVAA
jgi:hypothetical protein